MSSRKKAMANKIAKTGARTFAGLVVLFLKIIGTILLITVTTGLIFSCIFMVYVKTNLTSELGVSLEETKMSLSSVVYYEDKASGEWKELVTLQSPVYRRWVDYDEIPLMAERAVVAIEDQRFYSHRGVDWYRTVAAFGNMFLGMRDNFGGSTITQQLIKNVTEEDEVTVQRKLLEIFRALQFEKDYEKQEIIEWYLNVVNFGGRTYGIGAAANYYFGKEVSELSLAEWASIIGITNNPSKFNPYISKEQNKDRQELILSKMHSEGYISEEEMTEAKNEKLVFRRGEDTKVDNEIYTWFEDALIEDLIADLMVLKDCSYDTAENLLFTNGLKIYATIDLDIQAAIDSVYTDLENLPKVSGSSQQVQSAIVITDPFSGDIVGLSSGVGEKTESRLLRRATASTRPPGSSIKPLSVYAPAIEFGLITPQTRFEDSAGVRLQGTTWMPKNDDWKYSESGIVNVAEAVRRSKNTVAAQIVDIMTPARSYDFMTNILGLKLDPADADYAPLSLGQLTHGITVREMSSAFTMFVNGGKETHGRLYTHIYDANDNLMYENVPKTSYAISEVTAYWITSMLQTAATSGTGSEASLGRLMPTAGKTGSSTDMQDRWFTGYTPYYVAAVWTGYDMPAKMSVRGNPSSQLWKRVMTLIHEDLPHKEFNKPSDIYLSPIPGVDEPVPYIIRGVTVDGVVLYEYGDRTSIKGKNVTVVAQVLDGYELIGSAEKTKTITDDPANNLFEFYYHQIEAPPEEPSAEPSEEPPEPPEESPPPTPTGEPPVEPTPSTPPETPEGT